MSTKVKTLTIRTPEDKNYYLGLQAGLHQAQELCREIISEGGTADDVALALTELRLSTANWFERAVQKYWGEKSRNIFEYRRDTDGKEQI